MKKIKCSFLCIMAEFVLFCAVLFSFGGNPAFVSAQAASKTIVPADELDAAIRETSDYFNKQLPKGNKLIIINIQSDFPALSEYIIDELTSNAVNDRIFSVVDRQQLNTIRAELDFQMSGEVDDKTAQSLGRMAGAHIIITGAVSKIGDLYRMRIRALSVQTAQIEGQFNKNIPNGPTVMALVNSKATGYGVASTGSGQASTTTTGATTPASAQAAASANKTYNIGDKGPAGGIIFYDKGMKEAGWRYLEAAPRDFNDVQWGAADVYDYGGFGTKTAIGDGKKNTEVMVVVLQEYKETSRAAQLARAFDGGGYEDWFLPSQDELNMMYKNLKQSGKGGFSNGWYWSSSTSGSNTTYIQRFNDGTQEKGRRSTPCSVRFVRQF